jgi:hypothetical protein
MRVRRASATGLMGKLGFLLLLCLCLCFRPAGSQPTWLAGNYTTINAHSNTDAQAVVSDCYPYYDAKSNAYHAP